MAQNSLSLFETTPDVAPAPQPNAQLGKPLGKQVDERIAEPRDTRDRAQQHLLAARRLARRMARLPDQSPEQVRAGRMICRHLVAMLKEAEAQATKRPH